MTSIQPSDPAALPDELPHAIDRTVVQPARAVGLRLESDADVFDGTGEVGIGEAGEGAGEVELGVG